MKVQLDKKEFLKLIREINSDLKKIDKKTIKLKNKYGIIGFAYTTAMHNKINGIIVDVNELIDQLKPKTKKQINNLKK